MRSGILAVRSCQLNTSGPDENVYQINYSRYCIKLVDQKYALQDQILLSKKRNVLPNFSYSLWAVSISSDRQTSHGSLGLAKYEKIQAKVRKKYELNFKFLTRF